MTSDTRDSTAFALDGDTPAFYRRLGPGLYAPTVHVQGAWRDDEQHMAPVSGILAHEIDLHEPREGMQLARISFDILGMIPARPSRVEVRTTRPGRTIELVEATLVVDDRPVVRAHAWRLAAHDSEPVAGVELEAIPAPDVMQPWTGADTWDGRLHRGPRVPRRPGAPTRSDARLDPGAQPAPRRRDLLSHGGSRATGRHGERYRRARLAP